MCIKTAPFGHFWNTYVKRPWNLNLFWSKVWAVNTRNSGLNTTYLNTLDCWYCITLFAKVNIFSASKTSSSMKVNSSFLNYKNPHVVMKTLGLCMLYLSTVSISKPFWGTNIPLYCRQKNADKWDSWWQVMV